MALQQFSVPRPRSSVSHSAIRNLNSAMSILALRVEGLSKRYRIGQRESYLALRDVLARSLTAPLHWLRKRRAQSLEPGAWSAEPGVSNNGNGAVLAAPSSSRSAPRS
jgi:hypothetical protein